MKNRLKQIRKHYKLTQKELGDICGKSRNAITSYELGAVIPDDAFIKLFCLKFKVNEYWLRTGDGDIFTRENDNLLLQLIKEYDLTEADANFMKTFLVLDAQDRETMLKCMTLLTQHTADIIPKRTKPDHKFTTAEKRRIVNAELEAEEKAKTLSVFTGTNGIEKI